MTAPTARVRQLTYLRDNHQCVNCGATEGLSWQHRAAVGMGGAGSKTAPVTTADGVTACMPCNARFESDLQPLALALGWKLKRNRGSMLTSELPYFDKNTRQWYIPDTTGHRFGILSVEAAELLLIAGNTGA